MRDQPLRRGGNSQMTEAQEEAAQKERGKN